MHLSRHSLYRTTQRQTNPGKVEFGLLRNFQTDLCRCRVLSTQEYLRERMEIRFVEALRSRWLCIWAWQMGKLENLVADVMYDFLREERSRISEPITHRS